MSGSGSCSETCRNAVREPMTAGRWLMTVGGLLQLAGVAVIMTPGRAPWPRDPVFTTAAGEPVGPRDAAGLARGVPGGGTQADQAARRPAAGHHQVGALRRSGAGRDVVGRALVRGADDGPVRRGRRRRLARRDEAGLGLSPSRADGRPQP